MKKEPPRGNGAAHQAGRTRKSVARRATAPLLDFLTVPPENPEDEARRLFPGAEPQQGCLRAAFVAIAAARGNSAVAALLLARLRRSVTADPEELDDSLEGSTVTEYELSEAAEQLEVAFKECRRGAAMLRRSRRRALRRQGGPALRVIS